MPNLRETILGKAKPALVPITFCGEAVFIRPWSEKDLIDWTLYHEQHTDNAERYLARCRAIAMSVVDADGSPVFSLDDVATIATLPNTEIGPAFDAIKSIQGLAGDDDAKKN